MYDVRDYVDLLVEPGVNLNEVNFVLNAETRVWEIYQRHFPNGEYAYRRFLPVVECIGHCLATLPLVCACKILNSQGFEFLSIPPRVWDPLVFLNYGLVDTLVGNLRQSNPGDRFFSMPESLIWRKVAGVLGPSNDTHANYLGKVKPLSEVILYEIYKLFGAKGDLAEELILNLMPGYQVATNAFGLGSDIFAWYFQNRTTLVEVTELEPPSEVAPPRYPTKFRKKFLYNSKETFDWARSQGILDRNEVMNRVVFQFLRIQNVSSVSGLRFFRNDIISHINFLISVLEGQSTVTDTLAMSCNFAMAGYQQFDQISASLAYRNPGFVVESNDIEFLTYLRNALVRFDSWDLLAL